MTESQGFKDEYARELFAYERLMARSVQTNSMQWQAPSLALAAQAFLLNVALRPNADPVSTSIVCFVGVVITLMALQLMARHRYYFHLDQQDMNDLEQVLKILHISDRDSQAVRHPARGPAWLGDLQSFRVWQVGFLVIAVVDIGIGVDAWVPGSWVLVGAGVALLTLEAYAVLAWSWKGLLRLLVG